MIHFTKFKICGLYWSIPRSLHIIATASCFACAETVAFLSILVGSVVGATFCVGFVVSKTVSGAAYDGIVGTEGFDDVKKDPFAIFSRLFPISDNESLAEEWNCWWWWIFFGGSGSGDVTNCAVFETVEGWGDAVGGREDCFWTIADEQSESV